MRSNVTHVRPPIRPFALFVAFTLLATTSFSQILLNTSFEGSNPFANMTNNQSCCSYSVTASTAIVHDGSQSFKSEVRVNDPAVSSGYRAELTTPNIRDEGDMWYGWSMYFEANNAAMNDWTGCCGHVVQWHPSSSSGGAVLDLRADGGKFDFCVNPAGGGSTTHQPGTLRDIVPGRWYDVVMHVNWAASGGLLEVWLDGTLYYTRQVNWTSGRYFKFGMNRWNMTNTWTVYYDNLKIGRNVTYNDVAPTPSTAPTNQPPTVDAGANATITLPIVEARLSGSASDPDGTIQTRTWSWVSGPTTYSIASPAALATNITGLTTAGTYTFRLTVTDNDGASASDQVTVTVNPPVPPPNQLPVARAGDDITIQLPDSDVEVDGRSSSDPDGSITNYTWNWVSGPTSYSITNATQDHTTITGLVQGTYTFRLTVRDDDGATATDDIRIIVNAAAPPPNQLPVARAGNDITIQLPDNDVEVDGRSSSDPDGTITNYTWSWVSGPTSYSITNATQDHTTITGLVQGTYTFRLTVRDDDGATATDDIRIIVNAAAPPPNQPPVARAGTDLTIQLPNTTSVEVNGGNSTDPDGTITNHTWSWVSGPATYSITSPTQARTTITGLTTAGTYTFRLTVRDDDGATATDDIRVIVNAPSAPPPPANTGPVANAGNDIVVTLPTNTATLYGTGSTDPDGLISRYEWTQLSGPSQATIANPLAPNLQLSDLMIGEYVFQLKVTDNAGASATATVKVVVRNKNGEALYCNIYPNPTSSNLNINYIGNGTGKARIMIYDSHNHFVLGETVPKDQVMLSKTLDISRFRSGTYFLQITIDGQKKIVRKIVKL